MRTRSFKLRIPTIAVLSLDNRAVTIPAGEIINVMGPMSSKAELINAEWNSMPVQMFARDIVERGEEIKSTSA